MERVQTQVTEKIATIATLETAIEHKDKSLALEIRVAKAEIEAKMQGAIWKAYERGMDRAQGRRPPNTPMSGRSSYSDAGESQADEAGMGYNPW